MLPLGQLVPALCPQLRQRLLGRQPGCFYQGICLRTCSSRLAPFIAVLTNAVLLDEDYKIHPAI